MANHDPNFDGLFPETPEEKKAEFFGALTWYLEARNWAHDKMRSCPTGSPGFDVRMYHSLYFVYLVGAVDCVGGYLQGQAQENFSKRIWEAVRPERKGGYVRVLRNAIVHQGFNLTTAGHAEGTTLREYCPKAVKDRTGTYERPFKYLGELAEHCDGIVNPAIRHVLHDLDFFNPEPEGINVDKLQAFIRQADCPDFVKELAPKIIAENYPIWAPQMKATAIKNMRRLLGEG